MPGPPNIKGDNKGEKRNTSGSEGVTIKTEHQAPGAKVAASERCYIDCSVTHLTVMANENIDDHHPRESNGPGFCDENEKRSPLKQIETQICHLKEPFMKTDNVDDVQVVTKVYAVVDIFRDISKNEGTLYVVPCYEYTCNDDMEKSLDPQQDQSIFKNWGRFRKRNVMQNAPRNDKNHGRGCATIFALSAMTEEEARLGSICPWR